MRKGLRECPVYSIGNLVHFLNQDYDTMTISLKGVSDGSTWGFKAEEHTKLRFPEVNFKAELSAAKIIVVDLE